MKKSYFIICFFVLFLIGCKDEISEVGTMASTDYQQEPIVLINSLSVFRTDNGYEVVIEKKSEAEKIVKFAKDRKSYDVHGLTLIKNENISQYLNMSMDELKERLGEVHTDIGSGFYIPAYVTEDGFLIWIELEEEVVYRVIKMDILNNIIVEDVSN